MNAKSLAESLAESWNATPVNSEPWTFRPISLPLIRSRFPSLFVNKIGRKRPPSSIPTEFINLYDGEDAEPFNKFCLENPGILSYSRDFLDWATEESSSPMRVQSFNQACMKHKEALLQEAIDL